MISIRALALWIMAAKFFCLFLALDFWRMTGRMPRLPYRARLAYAANSPQTRFADGSRMRLSALPIYDLQYFGTFTTSPASNL